MVRRAADSPDQIARESTVIDVIIHDVKPVLLMHQLVLQHDDNLYFRSLHSRTLNTLNKSYLLPVDQDEVKVIRNNHFGRTLNNSCPAIRYSSPLITICLFGQKLYRSSKRGSSVWPAPQRQVVSPTIIFILFLISNTQSSTWGQVLALGRSPCDVLFSLLTSIGQLTLPTNSLGQRSLLLISPQYNLSASSCRSMSPPANSTPSQTRTP